MTTSSKYVELPVVTDITLLINDILSIELESDEESVSDEFFKQERLRCKDLLKVLYEMLCHSDKKCITKNASPFVVVFLAGLMGNPFSSRDTYSNESDRKLSENTLSLFLWNSDKSTIESFLHNTVIKPNSTLFDASLVIVQTRLKQSNVKRVPFFRDAGVWLLYHTTYPKLSDYMSTFLPLSLSIVHDYRTDMKLLGISCLRHIVKNCLKTELRYYGQADLIYESLFKLLYTQECEVLNCIYPCLYEFLQILEHPPNSSTLVEKNPSGKYDEICTKLLTDITIESRLKFKQVLLVHLDSIVRLLGSSVAKHTNLYIRAMKSILLNPDYEDGSLKAQFLTTTIEFIRFTWPLLPTYYKQLSNYIFAFLNESSVLPTNVQQHLLEIFSILLDYHRPTFISIISHFESSSSQKFFLEGVLDKLQIKDDVRLLQ